MEEIIGQRMREPINLRKFLNQYQKVLAEDSFHQIDMRKSMHLENDEASFIAAEKNCSIEHLQEQNDVELKDFISGSYEYQKMSAPTPNDKALNLESFNKLFDYKLNMKANPFKRSRYNYKMVKQGNFKNEDFKDIYFKELLISVRVYRPTRATHVGKTIESPVFAEEFQCLGSNYLTDLRDKISCVCNNKHFFDVSENPEASPVLKKTNPGYFFITDTFYNDMRNQKNPDYSQVIREWANTAEGFEKQNFKVAKMEETRFIDLTVSLGFPQHYQHHGNCEHVFVFSQIELLAPNNVCAIYNDYPILSSFGLCTHRLCNMCGRRYYDFIVTGSDRQIHDPAYLCSQCFHSFHYIDGKKVGEFKAYAIFQRNDNEYEASFKGNDSSDMENYDNDCSEIDLDTFWEGEEDNDQVLNIKVKINSKEIHGNGKEESSDLRTEHKIKKEKE